jgi:PKD repeat protein
MRLNFIVIIFILYVIQMPFVHGACDGTWPYCCSGCTAKDVAITDVWLTSDSTCTPGTPATATLWAKFKVSSSSARHCAHSAIRVKNLDGSWRLIQNYIGTLPTSDFELQISTVDYICGQSLEVKDIYAAWNTDSGTCAYNRCADYIPAKCYYSGSTINVPPPLIADFIFTKTCLGTLTSFTDKTTGGVPPYSYAWTFGDGTSSTAKDPTHTYASAGTYSVRLVVTDSQLRSSQRTYNVVVYPLPDCIITSPSPVCAGSTGNTASVANAGTGATYTWTITGGTITSPSPYTNSITWTAGSVSIASIKVTVTDAYCSKTCSKDVTINPLPDCTIASPSSVCIGSTGNTASVANAGTGATYAWTITGGTLTSPLPYTNSITWTAGSAGTASIKVTVTTFAGCAAPQCSKEIAILGDPIVSAGPDQDVCDNIEKVPLTGTNSGGPATYLWTSSGTTGTIFNPTSLTTAYYTPSAADKVTGSVTITLTATGCSDQSVDQMQIVIWEIPPVNVEALIG